MTNRQVSAYLASGQPSFRLDPVALADSGADTVLSWLEAQPHCDAFDLCDRGA